jgi:hypothetical protein
MQGVAAVLAGLLAERLVGGPATAIGILGCASLVITASLIPGLRRTGHRPAAPRVPGPGHQEPAADHAGRAAG